MLRNQKLTRMVLALVLCGIGWALPVYAYDAGDARNIDKKADKTLQRFQEKYRGASKLLRKADGVLVFSNVFKAAIGIGGEHGDGVLRIDGKTVGYYSIGAASVGFQLGASSKNIILLFMRKEALRKFREGSGWKIGVDGSVVIVNLGAGKDIDTDTIKDPIIGFVLGQNGLMFDLSLEGSKITRLKRD